MQFHRDGFHPGDPDVFPAAPGHRRPGDPLPATVDVLIAGTRGTCSYLVAAHAGPEANRSVAHGAGRKMSRAEALRRGRSKHTVEELRRTPLGSLVICGDRQLLFEEAPAAYKRIEQVIADLVQHDLATPVATTVPLVTYKTPERLNGDAGPARRDGQHLPDADQRGVGDPVGRGERGDGGAVPRGDAAEGVATRDGVRAFVEATRAAQVVDATGAGDSFNGGYLSARARGLDPVSAAQFGHRVAGVVIGHKGALVDPELVRHL